MEADDPAERFAHLVHGADDGLRAGEAWSSTAEADLRGDFRKACGGLGDLRGADGVVVAVADRLGEFVDFG